MFKEKVSCQAIVREAASRFFEVPFFYKYLIIIFCCLCLFNQSSYSQKQKSSLSQAWLGYNNQTRFSNKWGFWADGQLRMKDDWFNKVSQTLTTLGLTYYLRDDVRLTAAYCYVNHFPADNTINISQPEHRPWQQLQWFTRYPRLKLMQWIRLEERYRRKILNADELDHGYLFNFRLRYNLFANFAISKKRFAPGALSFAIGDEIHINFGKQIVYNYFDQNRFFVGFAYHTNPHDNLQFGYMNIFQQLSGGNKYRTTHVARVTYFHNVDLRKNKEKKKVSESVGGGE